MPGKIHSKAQFRMMQAAAHGHSREGISKDVAAEMLNAEPGGLYKKLPEHVKKGKRKRKFHG